MVSLEERKGYKKKKKVVKKKSKYDFGKVNGS